VSPFLQIILHNYTYAKRSFQWARYQLDNLFLLRTDEEQRAFIESLESPLEDVYERTLLSFESLSDADRSFIQAILRVLVGFLRPPQFEDLVMAARMDNNGFMPRDLHEKLSQDNVRKLFKGLVEIQTETGAYQFSHYSIREFLISSRLGTSAVRNYWLVEEDIHADLALRCLEILEAQKQTPFNDYASL
jgi:hypothetical protein